MISVETLTKLGYRICHAKNLSKAANTLKKVKSGIAVTHQEIDQSIRAIQFSSLSPDDKIILNNKIEAIRDE